MTDNSLLARSDRLWTGADSIHDPQHHPFATLDQIDEISEGVAVYKNWSNIVVTTTSEGMVLGDTGAFVPLAQERAHGAVRAFTDQPLHTAVYTHGHADHAYGLPIFLEEAERAGRARPDIIGHENVRCRMERYNLTAGFNAVINTRQFSRPTQWPTDPIFPSTEYRERLSLRVGETLFELHHAKGETDDHTWIYQPDKGVLHTGDLFIWSVPNAGNPQKVQRYCAEWISALREMAALRPRFLCPGHGLPIAGEERVRQALLETADYLESLWRQTVDLMNQGASVDDCIHTVRPPSALADRPFLQPIYDEPEFVVRNLWRCYGGWYSGTASELKPASMAEQGREIAELAGGMAALLERASRLSQGGGHRLASHLVDWAAAAEPESAEVHRVRAEVYRARLERETSTMARGIFGAAMRESENWATRGSAHATEE